MIEPELFNFRPPATKRRYMKKRWEKILMDLDDYGLTHSISVVLPDTIFIPSYIENIFAVNGQYYLIRNFTLSSLVDPSFITSFVKNGNIYAISLNTRLGAEDCISITNNNLLQLSFIESSYLNMCLPKKDSRIKLDLKKLNLNSKFYQRIYDCFQSYPIKFDLLICWEPNNNDVCPSSIASYFDKNGFDCQECFPRSTSKRKYNMTIPKGTDIELLDTWLSYFCLGIKIEDTVPSILPNGKLTKSNSCNVGQVTQIIWTGFFNNDKVKVLLEKFRYFIEKEGKSYWLMIHLEPFSNSPCLCTNRTILFYPDNVYHVSYAQNVKNVK